jgi:hypothetical protein
MKVYVVNIEHKHGADAFVYESKDDARQHIIDYVAGWWEDEKENSFDSDAWGEYPGGWEAVDRYFELVDDEYYSIQGTDLIEASNKDQLPLIDPAFNDALSDHKAYFQPQAWSSGYAVDVDAEGEQRWVISQKWLDFLRDKAGDKFDDIYRSSTLSDLVKDDPAAPPWIWQWSGPYYILVSKVGE